MTKRTKYEVTTKHGQWQAGNGTFTMTVETEMIPSEDVIGGRNRVSFVHGGPFGCSRNYVVRSDREAIERLLSEHATDLVACSCLDEPEAVVDINRSESDLSVTHRTKDGGSWYRTVMAVHLTEGSITFRCRGSHTASTSITASGMSYDGMLQIATVAASVFGPQCVDLFNQFVARGSDRISATFTSAS